MEPKNTDVKPNVAPSSTSQAPTTEAKTDVKPVTFDQAANAMIEKLSSGSSLDEEKTTDSPVPKKNTTGSEDEEKKVEEKEKETESTEEVETEEEVTEEEESEDAEETEDEAGDEEAGGEDEDDAKKDEADPAKQADGQDPSKQTVPFLRLKEQIDKVSALEPVAKAHNSTVEFCQRNGISPEQFRSALDLQALINAKPEEAIAKLEPLLEDLKVATGKALPKDLAAEVTEGTITEQRAKELALARLQAKRSTDQNRFADMKRQQDEQQAVLSTLQTWAESKRKVDPDFKPKTDATAPDGKFEDFLTKNIFYWVTTPPQTAAEAVAIAEKAYNDVQSLVKRYTPAPPRRKVLRTGAGGTSRKSSEPEEPKSYDDVVNQVGRKHGYNM